MRNLALFCLTFVVACGDSSSTPSPDMATPAKEDLTLPSGFLLGAAIAGFQVEMGCPTIPADKCDDPNSDWYVWVTDPKLVGDSTLYISGEPPSHGPGFYELYAADVGRAADEMHSNALRLSIEWSRIFPTATFGVEDFDSLKKMANPDGIAFYHAVFAALKAKGLKPFVTIDHYTLPTWMDDAEGCHANFDQCTAKAWADDRIVHEIAKYAGFVAKEYGGEVDLWATLNEPLTAVVVAGYLDPTAQRSNPPGLFLNYAAAKKALNAMIYAHARMYDAVHMNDTVDADGDGKAAQVGIVYNMEAVKPDDPTNPDDVAGAKNFDYLINQVFLNAIAKGQLDANLDGTQVHQDDLANRLDFLGINYYAQASVIGTSMPSLPHLSSLSTFDLIDLNLDWGYAKGIYEVVTEAKQWGVPIVISETGSQDPSDKGLASAWIVETLTWVKRAIADGAPVGGYFYWTLMDNYEWNHGMSIKMGLYAVDPTDTSKARKARSSVGVFAKIATAHGIPDDLAAMYPAPR